MTQTVRHIGCDVSLLKREIFKAVSGYMPVGRHYGFIYNEFNNTRTIAHELGHGTNTLHHTFSDDSESFHTAAKTDNLMDYNGGTALNHKQWQWSHEKHRNVLGFLDGEGESENISLTGKFYAVLNGNNEYKLYDKSSVTVLAGTDVIFNVLPDQFVYNQISISIQNKYDSILLISIKPIKQKIEITNKNEEIVKKTTLPVGEYISTISIDSLSIDVISWKGGLKNKHRIKTKYSYTYHINIIVVDSPIVRIEPTDREKFYLKFGYDDALIKENQQRGDYYTEQIGGETYFAPWLHIQPGVDAEMKLDFKYDETFVSRFKTTLKSISEVGYERNYTFSFVLKGVNGIKINGSDSVEILLDRLNNVINVSSSTETLGFVDVYTKDLVTERQILAGKLEVCCREIKGYAKAKLRIINTLRKGETKRPCVDAVAVLKFVNQYYIQAGIQFSLDDINYTNTFDVDREICDTINITKHIKEIVEKQEKLADNQTYQLYFATRPDSVYIDDNRGKKKLNTTNGSTVQGQGWTIILLKNGSVNEKTLVTAVHELGHALGLGHTFKTNNEDTRHNLLNQNTTINIMDYETIYTNHRVLFYKHQINKIHERFKNQ